MNTGKTSSSHLRLALFVLTGFLFFSACGLSPRASISSRPRGTTVAQATSAAMRLAALGTQAALSPAEFQTAIASGEQPAQVLVLTPAAPPVQTGMQNAAVLQDALCYRRRGRGGVISSVHKGDRVRLIGQNGKWLGIMNPVYEIPCWVDKDALQVDSSVDLASLPVYDILPVIQPVATPTPGG